MSRALLVDPALAKHLKENFITYAGAVERLQPSRYGWHATETTRWFVPMAKRALKAFGAEKFFEQFKSYQGFYVVGPDGRAYGYKVVWKLTPAEVITWLDAARAEYARRPPAKVVISDATVAAGKLPSAPTTASVIRVYSRVAPIPEGCPASNTGVGRDYLWVYTGEVRQIVASADEPGKVVDAPRQLAGRLVRFTLLDNVRNVGKSFAPEDVKTARFKVALVRNEGPRRFYRLLGEYHAAAKDPKDGWQGTTGLKGRLEGTFTVDVESARIVAMRVHGKATAWGQRSTESPEGEYPLVFALVDANDALSRTIPPVWRNLTPGFAKVYDAARLPE